MIWAFESEEGRTSLKTQATEWANSRLNNMGRFNGPYTF